jgi:hypothetical protein
MAITNRRNQSNRRSWSPVVPPYPILMVPFWISKVTTVCVLEFGTLAANTYAPTPFGELYVGPVGATGIRGTAEEIPVSWTIINTSGVAQLRIVFGSTVAGIMIPPWDTSVRTFSGAWSSPAALFATA